MAPLSVEQIARQAGDFEFDARTPLKYWLRSAGTLLKEANIYEREGNDEQAYLLLFRHAELVLVHLPGHPEAKTGANHQLLRTLQKQVKENLAKMETMKPRITKRYERYMDIMRQREQLRKERLLANRHNAVPLEDAAVGAVADLPGAAQFLEPAENKELAVQLAQREFHRRAAQRARVLEEHGHDTDDLSTSLQRLGLQLQHRRRDQPTNSHIEQQPSQLGLNRRQVTPSSSTYKYPTVPSRSTRLEPEQYLTPHKPLTPNREANVAPALPAKSKDIQRMQEQLNPPPVPSKTPHADQIRAETPSPRPTEYFFKPSATLESGESLRSVFISPEVRRHFVNIAARNTARNLETCGILCGSLVSNAFFISRLIIPEQTATSDTCEMINESAVFDYCDADDLIVIGWIHTHPTQTCFMSSRDLHTHSGFQVMLKESIAIVCAPSHRPEYGLFRLTNPPGLQHVLQCTKPGIFHPHSETNLYTDSLRPAGHVYEVMGLDFEVVDLRP
ncbi:hypothetical protein KEM54_006235 [Ascosphaera aggregata]|nr:hypothetical protein KEM54_006235 [Ascosphaera aggregata]